MRVRLGGEMWRITGGEVRGSGGVLGLVGGEGKLGWLLLGCWLFWTSGLGQLCHLIYNKNVYEGMDQNFESRP